MKIPTKVRWRDRVGSVVGTASRPGEEKPWAYYLSFGYGIYRWCLVGETRGMFERRDPDKN